MADSSEAFCTLIRRCQASTRRKPTLCECGGVLDPVVANDFHSGDYILMVCPDCDQSHALEGRDMMGFRVFGALLQKLDARQQAVSSDDT